MTNAYGLHAIQVLHRSLSLVWQHKGAFGILLVVLWIVEDQLSAAIEDGLLNLLAVYVKIEVLRVVLVSGTHQALRGARLSMQMLVGQALAAETWISAVRVAGVVTVYTMFVILCILVVSPVLLVSNVPLYDLIMVMLALWLVVDVPLFVLVPIAALERRGVLESFRRAIVVTSGSRREILQLVLVVGAGVGLPLGGASTVSAEVLAAGQASDIVRLLLQHCLTLIGLLASSLVAVVTTVCYYDLVKLEDC